VRKVFPSLQPVRNQDSGILSIDGQNFNQAKPPERLTMIKEKNLWNQRKSTDSRNVSQEKKERMQKNPRMRFSGVDILEKKMTIFCLVHPGEISIGV
jgi:hypothetical protein